MKLTRDSQGILVAEFHTNGGPVTFTAQDHTEFVEVFYRISQDRANKIVILAGPAVSSSRRSTSRPSATSPTPLFGARCTMKVFRFSRIWRTSACRGSRLSRDAHVHSEYALLANVIVAGEGATFNDVPHFAGGIVPDDGIFTTWSYRAGAARAEAFLLNSQPLTAPTAHEWGVVAGVVPNGKALSRARELAELYLKAPEETRRNTRVHFIQPLKERMVREVGDGLSLEGASAADSVKSMQAKSEPVA